MNILIIGSDSFIARHFFLNSGIKTLKGISRTGIQFPDEIIINDFSKIDKDCFNGVDVVINFAAIVHHSEIKDSKFYDEVNYKLAILNAQKAKQAKVKLFIQMSTIAVYGNATEITPLTLCKPHTLYGLSKLKADIELLTMEADFFKVAIVRPPMVYGGGKAPGNMMRLIKLADMRIPLPFKGIDNKRDFMHISNLTQYLKIIAEKKLSGIYLLSDHQPISTESLLSIIGVNLNKKPFLLRIPKIGLNFLKRIKPNEYNKLFGTLRIETNFPYEGLIHRYTIEEGIRDMVQSNNKVV